MPPCQAREPLFLLAQEKRRKEGHPDVLALRAFEPGRCPDSKPRDRRPASGPARRDFLSRRASERRPCRPAPEPPTCREAGRKGAGSRPSGGVTQIPKGAGALEPRSPPNRRVESPLCLASRARDCRVGLAWTRARGSPRHDVASNRPVRNRSFASLIVADHIRGDQARRAKAPGFPSFRVFSWTSKKIPSCAGHGGNSLPARLTGARNTIQRPKGTCPPRPRARREPSRTGTAADAAFAGEARSHNGWVVPRLGHEARQEGAHSKQAAAGSYIALAVSPSQ